MNGYSPWKEDCLFHRLHGVMEKEELFGKVFLKIIFESYFITLCEITVYTRMGNIFSSFFNFIFYVYGYFF